MICCDYTDFQIIKSECESQTQFICHFLTIYALFNFAAWVGFCRTSVTKGGQTVDNLIIYPGTLLHNGLPDILVFTDSQIDKRKG